MLYSSDKNSHYSCGYPTITQAQVLLGLFPPYTDSRNEAAARQKGHPYSTNAPNEQHCNGMTRQWVGSGPHTNQTPAVLPTSPTAFVLGMLTTECALSSEVQRNAVWVEWLPAGAKCTL